MSTKLRGGIFIFVLVPSQLTFSMFLAISLFYIFVLHLTLTIVLFTTLCICNIVIHFNELRGNPENEALSNSEVFLEVVKTYWVSLVGALFATLFSLFVFALCGFHTFLVFKALTTQEMLKKMYANMARSPFSTGLCLKNWKSVICWPRITHTRLYYMLYLKHRDEERFDELRQALGDKILPSEMIEPRIKLYEPPLDGGRRGPTSPTVNATQNEFRRQEQELIKQIEEEVKRQKLQEQYSSLA